MKGSMLQDARISALSCGGDGFFMIFFISQKLSQMRFITNFKCNRKSSCLEKPSAERRYVQCLIWCRCVYHSLEDPPRREQKGRRDLIARLADQNILHDFGVPQLEPKLHQFLVRRHNIVGQFWQYVKTNIVITYIQYIHTYIYILYCITVNFNISYLSYIFHFPSYLG